MNGKGMFKKTGVFILLILLIAGYIFSLIRMVNIYLADINYSKSKDMLEAGTIPDSITYANISIEQNPDEPAYYRNRAKILLIASAYQEDKTRIDLKKHALSDLIKAYSLNPKNLATLRNSLPLYYFLASKDLNLPGGKDNIDEIFLPFTVDYMDRLKKVSQTDAGIYSEVAKYEKRLGITEELNESVNKIRELRPDLLKWHEDLKEIQIQSDY